MARQTAAAVGAVVGVDPMIEPGVAETDFGKWEGSTFAEIREQWPDVRVLIYRPKDAAGALPAIFHIHGGGYVMGTPEMMGAGHRGLAPLRAAPAGAVTRGHPRR